MFGGWPHELLDIPSSEYGRLKTYYFAVKDAEANGPDESDEDVESE